MSEDPRTTPENHDAPAPQRERPASPPADAGHSDAGTQAERNQEDESPS